MFEVGKKYYRETINSTFEVLYVGKEMTLGILSDVRERWSGIKPYETIWYNNNFDGWVEQKEPQKLVGWVCIYKTDDGNVRMGRYITFGQQPTTVPSDCIDVVKVEYTVK